MKKQILCFGDSNTHGLNAIDASRFDENARWPKLLSNDYSIIEEGLSGRTTVFDDPITEGLSALNYITPCLMSHKPIDLLIIMLGTNDTKERFSSSPQVIGLGLKRLILKAQKSDCWANKPNILIITPKAIEPDYLKTEVVKTMGLGCDVKAKELSTVYELISKEYGCHYLDANEIVTNYNTIDYMHLDEVGHKQLAHKLNKLIPKLL